MKLTIEDKSEFDDTVRVIMIEDSVTTMAELVDLFCSAALALGYHPNTVNAYLRPDEGNQV